MTFNIREHVRHVLATTPGENVEDLADAVFTATPPEEYASAYRQALPHIVRVVLAHAERPDATDSQDSRIDQSGTDTQTSYIDPGDNFSDGGSQSPDDSQPLTAPPVAGPNLRNSRVALLRRSKYRQSVSIGDGLYRDIMECTRADLERAAAESEKLASENEAAAWRYRKLVKAMAEHGAQTVSDLTEDQLREVLGDE